MLTAREERAARQQTMAAAHHGLPLVSFSLNIPGEHKNYPLAREAFHLGVSLLERQLRRANLSIAAQDTKEANTGCECIIAVGGGAADAVKRIAVAIEENHPLGRLFDFDVIDTNGEQLRGEQYGRTIRRCIVCGKPVWECARSRAHPAEELARRTAQTLQNYFANAFADKIAAQATRALLYEVNTTPKPGLVDRANTGSHADMDIFTFIDSSVALTPFFREMTLAGMRCDCETDVTQLLPKLRLPGQWAEDAMFAATDGINTHKGLIFSLGILCAAAGVAKTEGSGFAAGNLLRISGTIATNIDAELSTANAPAATHGEKAFTRFGITGARGEAAKGFPDVRDCGYPTLSALLAKGISPNAAGAVTLLHLLSRVDDTNIIARSNFETLRKTQKKVAAILRGCGDDADKLIAFAQELDTEFITTNLSPGGCADLLALSFMLCFLEGMG